MKWFKHDNDLLQDTKVQILIDHHGTNFSHAYMRLMEILARDFDVEQPTTFVFSRREFFSELFPTCHFKTGKRILKSMEELGFKFGYYRKEIIVKTDRMKDLADQYTKRVLRDKEK